MDLPKRNLQTISLLVEGICLTLGGLIGYFCFDQLLFGFCFGGALGIVIAISLGLYFTSNHRQRLDKINAVNRKYEELAERSRIEEEA